MKPDAFMAPNLMPKACRVMVLSTHRKGKEAGMFYQKTMATTMEDAHIKTKRKTKITIEAK